MGTQDMNLAGEGSPAIPLAPLVDDAVVVVGRNFGNMLAMVRSLGEAGYRVEVLRLYRSKPSMAHPMAGMKPESLSKYVTRYEERIVGASSDKAVEALREFAASSEGARKLALPVDDYSLDLLDGRYGELSDAFLMPSIKGEAGMIARYMDKSIQKRLAAECGLPVLPGVTVTSMQGKFLVPPDVPFPCFVKPESSLPGAKSKMQRCDSSERLNELLSKFSQEGDFEVLLEAFADIQDEYSILGVATEDGVIAPCAFKHVLGGHKERRGVAVAGELVSVSELGELADACCRFVQSIGYVGIFDIDLIRTRDGGMYFEEVNFRPGSSTHAFSKVGVNLAKLFADDVLKGVPAREALAALDEARADGKCTDGKRADGECADGKRADGGAGKVFVNEKVLLEEVSRNDASPADYKAWLAKADICFVRDDADPSPYQDFEKYVSVAKALRLANKVRGR